MTTVYLDNNIEEIIPDRKDKIMILYIANEKRFIKFASIQINKIITMLKKQFNYDYTVNIVSHMEFTNFSYIDRSYSTSEFETTSDGHISSGKVFFYTCEESDSYEEKLRKLSRVSDGRVRIIIKENCLINTDPLYSYLMRKEEISFRLYKVSSINDQVFKSQEYYQLIKIKNYSESKEAIKELNYSDDVCLIEFDESFKCKLTGLTNIGKNKNFDKESYLELEKMEIFHKDDFTKSIENFNLKGINEK